MIKPPRHAVNSKGLVLNLTDRREVAAADAKNAGLAFALSWVPRSGRHWGWPAVWSAGSVRSGREAACSVWSSGAAASAVMSLALLPALQRLQGTDTRMRPRAI